MSESKSIIKNPILDLIVQRQSVRKFEERPVEREKILTCIEAARLAPSAENVQPWRFLVLDEAERIKSFAEQVFSGLYRYTRWAANAPVIIVIFAERDILANRLGKEIQGTHYYLIDVGIAGEHLVLQAEKLGLGSCWIGWFHAKNAQKFLGVPRGWRAVSLLAMGYPRYKKKEKRPKKKMEEILYFNYYKK
jgi:nitroreductase